MELRPYQVKAVDALLKVSRGIIKAPAGSGKTVIAAAAVSTRQRMRWRERVLWLAHTTDQLEQGMVACRSFEESEDWDIEFRCYAAGGNALGYDLVVCDECHHIAAPEFSKILENLVGGTVWGLSATPDREDELKDRVYELCGPVIYEVPREECPLAKGKVYFHAPNRRDQFVAEIEEQAQKGARKMAYSVASVAAGLSVIEVSNALTLDQRSELMTMAAKYNLDEDDLFRELKAALVTPAEKEKTNIFGLVAGRAELLKRAQWHACQDIGIFENVERNEEIVQLSIHHVDSYGDSVLILVGTIEHGKELSEYLGATLVHSAMGKKKRRQAIEDFRSGKLKCMIATSLADEGLDVPRANVLILAGAGRSKRASEQRSGRVMREFEGKEFGIVHDFWDWQYPMLLNQSRARKRVYKNLGYEVIFGDFPEQPVPISAEPPRQLEDRGEARDLGSMALTRGGQIFSKKDAVSTCEVASTGVCSSPSELQGEADIPPVNSNPPNEPQPSSNTVGGQPEVPSADPSNSGRLHAPLSPSTLKARAICPGFFSDPHGDKTASDRGSLGHKAIELEKPEMCGEDEQLITGVNKCIVYKHRIASTYKPDLLIYQEVKLHYFDQWGFCDVLIMQGPRADLLDWKFAYNQYEADSPQFWAYCLGVWQKFSAIEDITVHVAHPFLDMVDVEKFTRKEHYNQFRINVQAIFAAQAVNDPTTFRITEQCSFCGFARKCSKMAALGLEIGRRYAPEITLPEGTLHGSEVTDPNTMAALLKIARPVKKAAEGWGKAGLEMYDKGTKIPGFQLLAKKGNRSIASTKKAFEIIKAHFDPTMTPEKFLEYCEVGATALDDIVEKLAPERGKAQAKRLLEAHLEDNNVLDHGGAGRFLKSVKEEASEE